MALWPGLPGWASTRKKARAKSECPRDQLSIMYSVHRRGLLPYMLHILWFLYLYWAHGWPVQKGITDEDLHLGSRLTWGWNHGTLYYMVSRSPTESGTFEGNMRQLTAIYLQMTACTVCWGYFALFTHTAHVAEKCICNSKCLNFCGQSRGQFWRRGGT